MVDWIFGWMAKDLLDGDKPSFQTGNSSESYASTVNPFPEAASVWDEDGEPKEQGDET